MKTRRHERSRLYFAGARDGYRAAARLTDHAHRELAELVALKSVSAIARAAHASTVTIETAISRGLLKPQTVASLEAFVARVCGCAICVPASADGASP